MFTMENVFTSAKPFIFLAQMLGLFSMSFEGPPAKGIFKTKSWNVILTLLWLLMLTLVTIPSININRYTDLDSKVLPKA
jgi:hypothetical protein